jgi:hypothetical protein
MNRFVAVLLFLALSVAVEEQLPAQSRVPASAWEQLPQGFAIALTYNKSYVTLNIKNTSNAVKQIRRSSLNVLLFYADEHGVLIPLSNQKEKRKSGDPMEEILAGIDPPDSRGPMCFPPRMELWYQVCAEITPEDWSLIKGHPVVCHVELYDLTTNTKIHLESSPRILSDNS